MAQAKQKTLIALAFASFVGLGLRAGLIGVAWPTMRQTFAKPLDAMGLILLAATAGYLLTTTVSGRLMAKLGLGRILLLGSAVAGLGFLGYALAPRWWVLILFAIVAESGTAALDAGLNTYFAINQSAGLMNWLHACFGLGGTISPLIMVAILERGHSWRWGYVPMACAYGVLLIAFAVTQPLWPRTSGDESGAGPAPAPMRATLSQPGVWLGLLLFFTFTGVEGTSSQWPYTLFTVGRGVDPAVAGLWVSVLWGSLTVGRIVFGLTTGRLGGPNVMRLALAVAAMAAALIWWYPHPTAGFAAMAVLGFFLAPLFPTATATTPLRVGQAHAANAIGLQMAVARLGLAAIPALVGLLAGRVNLEVVGPFMVVNTLVALLLHEAAVAFGKSDRKDLGIRKPKGV